MMDKVNSAAESIHREISTALISVQDEGSLISYVKAAPKRRPRAAKSAAEGGSAQMRTGCECGEPMVLYEGQFRASCPRCGYVIEVLASTAYDRSERALEKPSTNKEIETAHDMLSMIQGGLGKESNGESPLQIDIKKSIGRIMSQLEIDYPSRRVTLEGVRGVLRSMSFRRFCKIAPYFYYRFTRLEPLKLTDSEVSRIMNSYTKIVGLWHECPKSEGGFKNLPNCRETIYKLVLGLNIDPERRKLILDHIYLPEENTLAKFITEFWVPMRAFAASRNVVIDPVDG